MYNHRSLHFGTGQVLNTFKKSDGKNPGDKKPLKHVLKQIYPQVFRSSPTILEKFSYPTNNFSTVSLRCNQLL